MVSDVDSLSKELEYLEKVLRQTGDHSLDMSWTLKNSGMNRKTKES